VLPWSRLERDIPIRELRAGELMTLNLSKKDFGLTEAIVLAGLIPVSPSLTVADLWFNQLDTESATMLANLAKKKMISLCGITPFQTVVELRPKNKQSSGATA
jgi:hypothetical protein